MSASSITDAIITNLSAASVLGTGKVGTHWATLETTSACCALVFLSGLQSTPWAMHNQHERIYTHRVNLYVKDRSGNALLIERETQQLIDISVCSLESDRTLQGDPDIREVGPISVTHDPTTVVEAGGATWYTAEMTVSIREWPDN